MTTGKNIALEFNDFSKNYTNDMIGCAPHYLQLVSSFVKSLPDNFKPNSILDLGCGNGNITAQLVSYFPNAIFTLVDASSEMIDLCRNQFNDYDFIYSNMYFKDFLFNAESYDLIVAGFSLHHCDNTEKQSVFRDINSSLKKGGIFSYSDLMITKTNPDHPMLLKEWGKFVNNNFPDGKKWAWVMEHYEAFDKPTDYLVQIEWLKNAGFSNIQIAFKKEYWVHLQAVK
ncbi:class I SAM-dependent methyltransferase [Gillisia limnaea]|uniref:Methyltransferase type 12 n=1 Tax=Gillisia limnaea (strain DSM 15749 / LMG 21470 / R-8282) TaxID=865937 RepID=H2BR38_GILLR|nr:class I SAM-dependent methyltransferase [Gillisia limnaea]EHQ04357.1 Methyltransferase type 12 [Gillisia limnaea DSM 15749]